SPFLCTAPTPSESYTLSLHDALPIWLGHDALGLVEREQAPHARRRRAGSSAAAASRLDDAQPAGVSAVWILAAPVHLRRCEQRRSEEHTSELQSPYDLVCRLLLEKKK